MAVAACYTAWDHDLAERLVRAVVVKHFKAGLFDAFPDLSEDDVAQELIVKALAEFSRRYSSALSGFSTWLTMFASARIHNIYRDRMRIARSEAGYRERLMSAAVAGFYG